MPTKTESSERITIEGFAGIAELDLRLQPFTVLIGPQSVGKSIVAKLLFLFKSTPRSLYLEALKDTDSSASESFYSRFQNALPSPTHASGAAKITYTRGEMKFVLKHGGKSDSKWEIQVPEPLDRAFRKLADGLKEEEEDDEDTAEANALLKEGYQDRVEKLWPGANVPPRFVPAGRAFFSQIERDVPAYLENAEVDPFLAEFWKVLTTLRARRRLREYLPTAEPAASLAAKLLSGRYAREGSEEFIYSEDGRKLPPKVWSSGQQEAQPLVLLLQRYCEGFFAPASLFIEEPEAHLFPASQRSITELIALAYNARRPEMEIFLTTHSPYILTTINNLLLAGQLHGQKWPAKKRLSLEKIVSSERTLSASTLGAYFMNREGCRTVIDPATHLVGSSAIDEVSGELNEQFDALLNFDQV